MNILEELSIEIRLVTRMIRNILRYFEDIYKVEENYGKVDCQRQAE